MTEPKFDPPRPIPDEVWRELKRMLGEIPSLGIPPELFGGFTWRRR